MAPSAGLEQSNNGAGQAALSGGEDSGADEEGEEEMEQNEEDDSQDEFDDGRPKQVRKHLARIEIPFKGPENPIIFSYHYKYEKYLRDNHLLDVSTILKNLNIIQPEKSRLIEAKMKLKQQKESKNDAQAPTLVDGGEDLSMEEDNSYPGMMSGKYRFDTLIKTMIARLEYNNTLAPV